MQRVHGVHKPVRMKSAGYCKRQNRSDRRPGSGRDPIHARESVPQQETQSDHRSDPREEAQRIAHVLLLPRELRHRNFRINRKCYKKRLYHGHAGAPFCLCPCFSAAATGSFPFLATGIPAITSTTTSERSASLTLMLPSARRYSMVEVS